MRGGGGVGNGVLAGKTLPRRLLFCILARSATEIPPRSLILRAEIRALAHCTRWRTRTAAVSRSEETSKRRQENWDVSRVSLSFPPATFPMSQTPSISILSGSSDFPFCSSSPDNTTCLLPLLSAVIWPTLPTSLPHQTLRYLNDPFYTSCQPILFVLLFFPPHFLVFLNFCHPNLNLKLDQTLPCYLCQYLPGSISLPMNHCKHPVSSSVSIWVLSQVSARRFTRACFTKTI